MGTVVFFLLFLAAYIVGWVCYRAKRLSRDNAQVYCVSIAMAVFCAWLMWALCWIHQWHPLVLPTGGGHFGAGSAGGGGH